MSYESPNLLRIRIIRAEQSIKDARNMLSSEEAKHVVDYLIKQIEEAEQQIIMMENL